MPVSAVSQAAEVLWQLLEERPPESNISHNAMPTWAEHASFVERYPYRSWYLIKAQGEYVGSIYLSRYFEVGVAILKAHQRRGYAKWAIRELVRKWARKAYIRPVPGVRRCAILANIAPANEASRKLFEELGFVKISDTYALDVTE